MEILFLGFIFIGLGLIIGIRLIYKWYIVEDHAPFLLIIPFSLIFIFIAANFLVVAADYSGFFRFIFSTFWACWIMLASIMVFFQVWQGRKTVNRKKLLSFTFGAILVMSSYGFGLLGSQMIFNRCESSHIETGEVIINSIEDYYADNHRYPESLMELQPEYLSTESIHSCYDWGNFINRSSAWGPGFHYKKCKDGTVMLGIPVMGKVLFHQYYLDDKEWSLADGDPLELPYSFYNCVNDN